MGGPESRMDGLITFFASHYALRAETVLKRGGLLAIEVGQGQSRAVEGILERSGLRLLETQRDLAGIPRVVKGRR